MSKRSWTLAFIGGLLLLLSMPSISVLLGNDSGERRRLKTGPDEALTQT